MAEQPTTPQDLAHALDVLRLAAPDAHRAAHTVLSKKWETDPDAPILELLTADEILTTEWPEPVWAIPRLLPVGLSILAGRPKIGKSWLALQIALAVAAGGVALGERVEKGPVLYLALEDSPRRLSSRMKKQGWPVGLLADFMPLGQFEHQIDDLRDGGGARLAAQIERVGYRFVVIDTLSRSVYGDQNDVEKMTHALAPLHVMAHAQNCTVMLVDHHAKPKGTNPNPVDDVLGSTGKVANPDTIWGLYRERNKAGARLAITGREVAQQNLALKMDWLTGCWQSEGDADQLKLTEKRQELLAAVTDLQPVTLKELAEALERNKGSIYRDLQELANAGLVRKTAGGLYYSLGSQERGERE